jgi:hypothetical protein
MRDEREINKTSQGRKEGRKKAVKEIVYIYI